MVKIKIANIIFDLNVESKILNERLTKYQVLDDLKAHYKISTLYVDEIQLKDFEVYKEFNDRILCKTDICDKILVFKDKNNQTILKIEYFYNDKDVRAYFKKDLADLEIKEYNLISMLVNEFLLDNNLIVVHGSAIAFDNFGIIFSAPSGTGKSTHSNLWKMEFDNRVTIINDDKPIIEVVGERAYVIGSPWSGKTNLNADLKVPLKAIVFLEQAKHNMIFDLSSKEMLKNIFNNFIKSDDINKNDMIIDKINRLAKIVKFYRLECNISREAVKLVYNKIFGEKI